jgi:hypothetical protein
VVTLRALAFLTSGARLAMLAADVTGVNTV